MVVAIHKWSSEQSESEPASGRLTQPALSGIQGAPPPAV